MQNQMLVNDVGLEIRAAYGSSKDISVYASVSIKPDNIYIVGKVPRKQQGQAQSLIEGKFQLQRSNAETLKPSAARLTCF